MAFRSSSLSLSSIEPTVRKQCPPSQRTTETLLHAERKDLKVLTKLSSVKSFDELSTQSAINVSTTTQRCGSCHICRERRCKTSENEEESKSAFETWGTRRMLKRGSLEETQVVGAQYRIVSKKLPCCVEIYTWVVGPVYLKGKCAE